MNASQAPSTCAQIEPASRRWRGGHEGTRHDIDLCAAVDRRRHGRELPGVVQHVPEAPPRHGRRDLGKTVSSARPREESRKRPRDEGSALGTLGGAAASSPAAVRAAEPALGGDAGGSAPGSECVMLWGRCWSQLRYK